MLMLFPRERPEYPEGYAPSGDEAVFSLDRKPDRTAVTVRVTRPEGTAQGETQVESRLLDEAPERVYHTLQHALKMAFYRAGTAVLGQEPPWGALTGVRPVKLPTRAMLGGKTPEEARAELEREYRVSPSRAQLAVDCARASLAARDSLRPDEVSLYVGIPFCPTRCAYCSFVSNSVEKSFHLVEPYLEALLAEVDSAAELVRDLGLRIKSFYMGGGTPTTLTAEQMDRLLGRLNDKFDMSHTVEYTVEAGRPDTITAEKLAALRRNGVTRVSINPQSMDDRVLAAIGRRHTADDIRRAMELVAAADFPHVNMDLIAGLPEDSPEGFRRSLDEVIAMGADDITVHTLSLKKGSRITLEGTRLPAVEEVAAMLDYADGTLRGAGFAPYYLYRQKYMSGSFENVGWCRPGGVGWYNIYIMEELHSILSLGAGGSTKMVDSARQRIERVFNLKYPQEYIQRPEKVRENQRAFRAFYENGGK